MRLRFGVTPRGALDTAAAAEAMGVSPRSVQRWLHASHGRSIAHIPPKRLEHLVVLLLPSPDTREREAKVARNAERSIRELRTPRRHGVLPSWKRLGWDKEHVVAVLEIKSPPIRQITIGRATDTKLAEMAKRGRVIASAQVPTRFDATLLAHKVLREVGPWRFEAGADQVRQGFTQAWMTDAPRIDLTQLAEELVKEQAAEVAAERAKRRAEQRAKRRAEQSVEQDGE